jgi:hypothetical protein
MAMAAQPDLPSAGTHRPVDAAQPSSGPSPEFPALEESEQLVIDRREIVFRPREQDFDALRWVSQQAPRAPGERRLVRFQDLDGVMKAAAHYRRQ